MTDEETLLEARYSVWCELRDLTEQVGKNTMYDPRPRINHLKIVSEGLDRMIRERHEAYR